MIFRQIKEIRFLIVALCFLALNFGCVSKTAKVEQSTDNSTPSSSQSMQEPDVSPRQLTSVRAVESGDNVDVFIEGSEKLVYTSLKQSFPYGIAIYFPATRIGDHVQPEFTKSKAIDNISLLYADEDQKTAKVEILLNDDLEYSVSEYGDGLKFHLAGKQTVRDQQQISSDTDSQAMGTASTEPKKEILAEELVIPNTITTLSNIEFTTDRDGSSKIHIKTDHPVNYVMTQPKQDSLVLQLDKTVIPSHHQRPIITTYFKSAVERIMPVQTERKSDKASSEIQITLRDQVPYHITQTREGLFLTFDPSTITPPKFTKAKKNLASGTEVAAMGGEQGTQGTSSNMTMTQSGNKGTSAATGNNVKLNDERSLEELISGKPKTYTGKPIKIDFYETDIKNVFRILRTISGLNFAIDKNVSGKVTMTLDKPVPWDQVLDLVLKMNDLGKIQEGNVLRIARKATIKKEDKARRELIAAKRKELAERKSLEPLVTEYIPINYSDAAKDIKPHIDKILTKGRGKLSIDKRTNMLIITDTKDKIAQAKGIIYRLDRVTPQIMIEAKVVEVSDDFTKELGVGWLVNRNESADYTGQNYDYSVALNLPQGNNFGNFTFYRILGSMVTSLNAQIAASETKGDVKIVSSPRILTLDNKKASIKQGLEYAYLERDDTGGSSVKFKSIDLALDVTPHVTPDQRIAMQIKVTKNDIASITNGVPSLTTNEANTELLVNDNDTVIIGGVVKKSITTGTTGVPYLKHIPIVGQLFRTDTKNDRRNELMIFLTPKIVQLTQKENVLTTSTSLQ